MSGFVSFPLFGFTLVIKLRNVNFESHWKTFNLTSYIYIYIYIYIYMTSDWKSFNGFQNWHFSVLWLKWTQTVGMKQNQTFFHWTYSNRIFFITGWKILKYFNDLDLSISLQKWVETSYQQIPAGQQIQTGHVQIRQYFWPFAK